MVGVGKSLEKHRIAEEDRCPLGYREGGFEGREPCQSRRGTKRRTGGLADLGGEINRSQSAHKRPLFPSTTLVANGREEDTVVNLIVDATNH